MNETIKSIHQRMSCRNYLDTKLPKDILNTILEAGLQAPSSMNRQRVILSAITNESLINELKKAVAIKLEQPESYSCFYNANTIVIVSAPKDYSPLYTDGSCVLQNIFLSATSLGIGSCWINQLCGIEDDPKIRELLKKCNIPDDHHICGCASLGYPNGEMTPKEKDSKRIQIIK